jgi:hypothetical protein
MCGQETRLEAKCHAVCMGTIADLDADEQLGLIESDDGRILPFHLKGATPAMQARFAVGKRVRFVERPGRTVARATALIPIDNESPHDDSCSRFDPSASGGHSHPRPDV